MFKVGLTGGIASGKSTVANLFQIRGINIIDADVISKELVAPDTPCYQAIINLFGQDIVLSDRNLNRKQMREQIFSNPELKTKLESILHPAIQYEIINQSEASSSPYCVVVIPLLFESQMHNLVDRTLTVDIDTDTQLERLMNRDDIDASLAKKNDIGTIKQKRTKSTE
jgi:dephospho-CoA kinase